MDGSRTFPNFEDFDEHGVFSRLEASILSADALNFLIEFDTDTAVAGTDLNASAVRDLLNTEVRVQHANACAVRFWRS